MPPFVRCSKSLTAREKEVIGFLSAGLSNKQIGAAMGISDATAKVHRANVMRKMEARSLAELVRMADLLGVNHQCPPAPNQRASGGRAL